jgi:Sortase domain
MARHRARGVVPVPAVVVPGVLAAATGLVLLLVPEAPLAVRSGTVLGGPAATSSTPAGGLPGDADGDAAGSAAPVGTEEPARAPIPLTLRTGFVPDRVVVDALGVDSPLLTTLVDADGALVPPADPDLLGWWRGVRPGSGAGSVVVAGHVDSERFGPGPLARLVDLVPGDRAVLTGPDGVRMEYVVRGVETFVKEQLPAAELFTADGAERLVLVTCGGTFDRASGSWDSNIVAVLDPVPA